jgi:hypothetical protein
MSCFDMYAIVPMKPADGHSQGNEKMLGSNEGAVNIGYTGHICFGTANTVEVSQPLLRHCPAGIKL